jgi:hypothetical protein
MRGCSERPANELAARADDVENERLEMSPV